MLRARVVDRAACRAAGSAPARVRPARPARCVAEAREIRCTFSVGSPDHGECDATRASPLSITATTPSMVTEVSATLVDRITLRRGPARTARSCSVGREIAVQRQRRRVPPAPRRARTPPRARGSRARRAGTPARRRRARRRRAAQRRRHLLSSGRSSSRRAEVLDRHVEAPPLGAQRRRVAEEAARSAPRRASPTSPPASARAALAAAAAAAPAPTSPAGAARGTRRAAPRRRRAAPGPRAAGASARPSVTNRTRVVGADDVLEAHLVADASRPTRSPSSSATRRAARRAASRRGSSTRISPSTNPASSSARGTRVVLPAPGGASSTSSASSAAGRDDLGKQRIDRQRHEPHAARRRLRELLLLRARLGDPLPAPLLRRLQSRPLRRRLPAAPIVVLLRMLHRHGLLLGHAPGSASPQSPLQAASSSRTPGTRVHAP